jgi:hypothetical protein
MVAVPPVRLRGVISHRLVRCIIETERLSVYQSAVLLFHTHPLPQLWVALPFSPACFFVLPVVFPDLTGPSLKTSHG